MSTSRSKISTTQADSKALVTMEAVQAIMNSFELKIRAMEDRINSKIAESRSRLSSPILPTPQSPQSDLPTAVLQQQSSSPAKKKRNERTRQQYKRKKALHVTVQSSVKEMKHTIKEVEHTVRVEHKKKPNKHVVLQRTKQVP